PFEGDLSAIAGALEGASSDQALLKLAALLGTYQRAGRLPAHDSTPLPDPSQPDELPRCTSRAAYFLTMILDGAHKQALEEWLTLLITKGQRVPEEKIPALLTAGARDSQLRPLIQQAIGKRGHWLAAQNPQWNYAAINDQPDESVWQTGNH